MKNLIKKLRKKAGFTLAELLIVVAIIAVLVAIAIPIFTSQLEKSREATDLANIRSAYAQGVSEYLMDGSKEIKIEVKAQQKQDGWQSEGGAASTSIGTDIATSGGSTTAAISVPAKTDSYTVVVSTNGTVKVE